MPLDTDDLNRLLFQTEQARRLLVGDRLSRYDLIFGQWLALDALYKEGLSSMTALAAMVGADRTTLTRTVDGLVSAGLVERTTPQADRRLVLVDLTPTGRALAERVQADLAPTHASVFAGLSREELDRFSVLLARSLAQIRLAAAEGPKPELGARPDRPRRAGRRVQRQKPRARP